MVCSEKGLEISHITMQVLDIINYIPSSKPDKETSNFLWPVYCSTAGKSHTSATEHLFLFFPSPFPSHLFFSPWPNALKSERLWHRFDRPTSEIPSLEEIKAVWCPALMEGGADELVSGHFSLQSWCVGEKKEAHWASCVEFQAKPGRVPSLAALHFHTIASKVVR